MNVTEAAAKVIREVTEGKRSVNSARRALGYTPIGLPEADVLVVLTPNEAVTAVFPNRIACDLDFPVAPERALAWAKRAQWFFRSYYKYAFVFEAYCTVAYPDDPEAHEVSALVEVCGETSDDIYRFQVQDPMTWDEISYPGTPELVIRDGDTELVRV